MYSTLYAIHGARHSAPCIRHNFITIARTKKADLCKALALPLSAECLKDVTGLTNMRFQDMDAWSQAMIDGIANYTGNKEIEGRCNAATAGIDAAIDDMIRCREPSPRGRL